MFALHSITLTNFRVYRGTVEFEFPDKPGLYFFTGENAASPALGANAAGKSTLLDGITWILFNRTTRGLKANEVISWGATSCAGTLELTVGDSRLQVQRTQKPNGLFLNGTPVDQDELEKTIRLNFESFLNTVIKSQFGTSFLSLSPANKLTLFSEILKLDFWLERSEVAEGLVNVLSHELATLTNKVEVNSNRIEILTQQLADAQEMSKVFNHNKKVRIATKEGEIEKASSIYVSMDEKIIDIIDTGKARIKNLNRRLDIQLEHLSKAVRSLAGFKSEEAAAKRSLFDYQHMDKYCHTCHQPIDNKFIEKQVSNLTFTLSRLETRIDTDKTDIEMYKRNLVSLKGKISAVDADIEDARNKESETRVLQNKVARLEGELEAIRAERNPHEEAIKITRDKISLFGRMVADDKKNITAVAAEHEAHHYWVKGFKQIRLFIIEQAFQTLEVEVNNCLAQLGMSDWQITFDIERENKSGGVTKGFVVFVQSPANSEPVRWENWSGGETQRLQLAGDLGLANLIMQQNGLVNTVEFYDEPSTHLSAEGMMDLADMLHDRAISEGKCIWIVDHSSITNFGDFEGIITARKDKNGSALTYRNS